MAKYLWTEDSKAALKEQGALRELVRMQHLDLQAVERVLAVGVAYSDGAKRACAVGIHCWPEGSPIDAVRPVRVSAEVDFPYIPGLLAYREGPAVCALLDGLDRMPDFIVFDSQGIAHPRRFGLACHIGVLYGVPTFGLTRTILSGRYADPARDDHASLPIYDSKRNSIGLAYRFGANCETVFASPGHLVDLESLRKWLRSVDAVRYCFPEALQRAHSQANSMARQLKNE